MSYHKKYKDKYGIVWERINYVMVWNKELGYGGWFDGEGLSRI